MMSKKCSHITKNTFKINQVHIIIHIAAIHHQNIFIISGDRSDIFVHTKILSEADTNINLEQSVAKQDTGRPSITFLCL